MTLAPPDLPLFVPEMGSLILYAITHREALLRSGVRLFLPDVI